MAIGHVNPWPAPTAKANLAAARTCLREAIAGARNLSDTRIDSLGATAAAQVERYAPGAPQVVRNEATIRLAGWLFHRIPRAVERVGVGELSLDFRPYLRSTPAAMTHSGAAALLSPWKVRRAGAIG